MAKFTAERADLGFEAGFLEPAFDLARSYTSLVRSLFVRLSPYGLRLSDIKIERGGTTLAVTDAYVYCYLFNFIMTARIRMDRVEVTCTEVAQSHYPRFAAAIVDLLVAVQEGAKIRFGTYAAAVGLHGRIDGVVSRDYLARFAAGTPGGLGPSTGNGAVFYFGRVEDQLWSSVTLDVSAAIDDGIYVKPHVVWDATKVDVASLPSRTEGFVRKAMAEFGAELSQ